MELLLKNQKLDVKIFLIPASESLIVSQIPVSGVSTVALKNAKKLQGTTLSKIKQILIETTYILYHKLNFCLCLDIL